MMWPYGYDYGFMGWWMILPMVVFWGGLIALIVWGVRRLTGCGVHTGGINPIDVAKERYARGEITREQFEQLKKDLS